MASPDASSPRAWHARVPLRSLSLAISALLVLAGAAATYNLIDWQEIFGILLRLDLRWFVAALAAYWALYPVNAARLQFLLRWVRHSASLVAVPFRLTLKLTCGAGFVAVAAPIGLIADAAKIGGLRFFARISLVDATRCTLFDRVVSVQWLSILGVLALLQQASLGVNVRLIGVEALFFSGALAAIGVLLILPKWLSMVPIPSIARFEKLFAGYKSTLTPRRTFAQLAIALVNVGLVWLTLWFLLRATGLTMDVWLLACFVPFLQFINSIPFLYMGWGGREIAVAATLGTVSGLSLNEALAISGAWGVVLLLTGLINGIFLLGDWALAPSRALMTNPQAKG